MDYAVNRTYSSAQGRFTQVDPIGMSAASLGDPQTLNMYSYCGNDPINRTDPDGLFWGAIGRFFKKVGKIFAAVGRAIAVVLNNKWVRIGVFVASFLIGFSAVTSFLGKTLTAAIKTGLKTYNIISDIGSSLELTGLLFQGKFKELGISIGVGAISSAISVIADGVYRGVKDSFVKNGKFSWKNFSFKGFFSGALKGFKRGLNDVFGRGWNSLVPAFGRYCAPGLGNGGGGNNGEPLGGYDGLCNNHDKAYRNTDNKIRLDADIEFLENVFKVTAGVHFGDLLIGSLPSGGNVHRFLMIPTFSGIIAYRKLR